MIKKVQMSAVADELLATARSFDEGEVARRFHEISAAEILSCVNALSTRSTGLAVYLCALVDAGMNDKELIIAWRRSLATLKAMYPRHSESGNPEKRKLKALRRAADDPPTIEAIRAAVLADAQRPWRFVEALAADGSLESVEALKHVANDAGVDSDRVDRFLRLREVARQTSETKQLFNAVREHKLKLLRPPLPRRPPARVSSEPKIKLGSAEAAEMSIESLLQTYLFNFRRDQRCNAKSIEVATILARDDRARMQAIEQAMASREEGTKQLLSVLFRQRLPPDELIVLLKRVSQMSAAWMAHRIPTAGLVAAALRERRAMKHTTLMDRELSRLAALLATTEFSALRKVGSRVSTVLGVSASNAGVRRASKLGR